MKASLALILVLTTTAAAEIPAVGPVPTPKPGDKEAEKALDNLGYAYKQIDRALCYRGAEDGTIAFGKTAVDAIRDPAEKQKWLTFYGKLKAYADGESIGPAEYGGWKGYDLKWRAYDKIPDGQPTTEAEVKEKVAALLAYKQAVDDLAAASRKLPTGRCAKEHVGWFLGYVDQGVYAKKIEDASVFAAGRVSTPVTDAVRDAETAIGESSENPDTMGHLVGALGSLNHVGPQLALLPLFAPLLAKPEDQELYRTGFAKKVEAAKVKLGPPIVAGIGKVKPDKAIKDAQLLGIAKQVLGSQPYVEVRVIEGIKSTTRNNDVKDRGDKHYVGTTKYRSFVIQRIMKVPPAEKVELPGMSADDICILQNRVIINYDKAFDDELHKWMFDGESSGSPLMLCKNR